MSPPPETYLTKEQYLEIERADEFKSEYYQGEMFPMGGPFARAGAKESHNSVVANLIADLHRQLRPRPCRTYPSDMRIRVGTTAFYTYPDVAVVCGEPKFLDEKRDTLLNPNLIVEVLSASTEAYDRGRKFAPYQSIESLSEYLLVSSDHVRADLFTRQPDDRWLLTSASRPEDSLDLTSVDCRITLSGLYEKVDLTA